MTTPPTTPETAPGAALRFSLTLDITGDPASRLGEVPQIVLNSRAERVEREYGATARLLSLAEAFAPLVGQLVADAFKPKQCEEKPRHDAAQFKPEEAMEVLYGPNWRAKGEAGFKAGGGGPLVQDFLRVMRGEMPWGRPADDDGSGAAQPGC